MITCNDKPKRILVFNPLKRLVAIFHSSLAASKSLGASPQSIHYACSGRCISCCNLYFRHLDDNLEVTLEDLGTLSLTEYDKLCGVKRKVYKTKDMSRKGMKYNTK